MSALLSAAHVEAPAPAAKAAPEPDTVAMDETDAEIPAAAAAPVSLQGRVSAGPPVDDEAGLEDESAKTQAQVTDTVAPVDTEESVKELGVRLFDLLIAGVPAAKAGAGAGVSASLVERGVRTPLPAADKVSALTIMARLAGPRYKMNTAKLAVVVTPPPTAAETFGMMYNFLRKHPDEEIANAAAVVKRWRKDVMSFFSCMPTKQAGAAAAKPKAKKAAESSPASAACTGLKDKAEQKTTVEKEEEDAAAAATAKTTSSASVVVDLKQDSSDPAAAAGAAGAADVVTAVKKGPSPAER